MKVTWLHGADAKDLRTNTVVSLNPVKTTFDKFKTYSFDDVAKEYRAERRQQFNSKTNENGEAQLSGEIFVNNTAPGKLSATFVTKVFEKSGNFSTNQMEIPYHPYWSYVGMKLDEEDETACAVN